MNTYKLLIVATTIYLAGSTTHAAVTGTGTANVRNFGAQGDGHSDDSAAILKAVKSVPERGGVVYFPAGQYLSNTIPGRNGVTFKGDSGWDYRGASFGASTIIPVRDDLPCLFDLKGSLGTRLVGLVLDGKGKGQEMHGVYSKHPGTEQNTVIDDCKITGFSGSGIRLDNVWVFAIRHSYIVHNKLSGIDGSGSYDGWILDNQITGNQRGGIYGTSFATVTITANRIEWNKLGGIVLGPAGANTIQIGNCTFDRNFGPGIDISLPSTRAASSAHVFNGNSFRRNGYQREDEPEASAHLRLRNVKGVSVTGNAFHGDPHRKDAQEGRAPSPINGLILEGLVDSVVANNSLYHAAQKTLILDKGGHQNTVIRDNPGTLSTANASKGGTSPP
jgi:hypothetical protein